MTLAHGRDARPATAPRLAAVVACLVGLTSLVACGVSSARPPVLYATGHITAVDGRRIEADIGTHNGAVRGSTLLIFDVVNEETDPRTGALASVDLLPTGAFRVHDADDGECVGEGPEGAQQPVPGQYVRLVRSDAIPTEGWSEDAASWWRAIRNRDAIVGTGRTHPFYRAEGKGDPAE